jgi:hypothetical protein
MMDAMASEIEVGQLLHKITELIVDDPAAIRVEVIHGDRESTLRLHVAPTDVEKLTSAQGRLVLCLRLLLDAMGKKHKHRFLLHLSPEASATLSLSGD